MSEYWTDFVQESEEHITALNNTLLELERSPDDRAAIDRIFRTAHTLKGNCGAMGLTRASDLAHAIEDLLDGVRTDRVEVSPELMDTIFDGVDELESMIDEVARHREIRTDPTETIESLRAPIDETAAVPAIDQPTDEEIDAVLARFDPPSDDEHEAYFARMAIDEDESVNNGWLVVEALIDAFDLIGTDPSTETIDNGEYGATFDAVFGSAVGEAAIAAALEPVDAVADFEIAAVTDRFEQVAAAEVGASVEDAVGDEVSADDAQEMSVDELLDEFEEFDDLDAMVEEIEDDELDAFDDMGEAGSFDDLLEEEEEPATPEETGEAVEAEPVADAEDAPSDGAVGDDADDEVDDASAVFAELKEEVEMVGFDELQDELAELEFDEFDDEDEVGMDELLGDDVDVEDTSFLEIEEDELDSRVDDILVDDDPETADAIDDTDDREAIDGDEPDGEAIDDPAVEPPAGEAEAAEAAVDDDLVADDEDFERFTFDEAEVDLADGDDSDTADVGDPADEAIEEDVAALGDVDFGAADAEGEEAIDDADETAFADAEEAVPLEPVEEPDGDELDADESEVEEPAVDESGVAESDAEESDVRDSDVDEPEIETSEIEESTIAADDTAADDAAADDVADADVVDADAAEADVADADAADADAADADAADADAADADAADADDPIDAADASLDPDGVAFDPVDAEFDEQSIDFEETEVGLDADVDESDVEFDESAIGLDSSETAFDPAEAGFDDVDDGADGFEEHEPEFEAETFEASDAEFERPETSFDPAADAESAFEGSIDEGDAFAESGEDESEATAGETSGDDADGAVSATGESDWVDADADVPEITVPDREERRGDDGSDAIQSVRVDVDQIDSLLTLVEGLVTSRVRLRHAIEQGEDLQVIDRELDDLDDITSELQETVMDVRLVPLQTVANRLPRVVRDISRDQNKEVVFEMAGEDVELDRSVLDRIGDPLIHLVRNAVDHGIESPSRREAAGKAREGTVSLRAERTRDRVMIEVEDDGSGLDPDRLRAAAVDADVLSESEADAVDDEEALDLIFHPGLSTADEVTDVSGRGVGMDVVKRTIDDLDGSVSVRSEPGEGTTVEMTLPVTVAIAEVLFVKSGGEEFGVPIKDVQDIESASVVEATDGGRVIRPTEDGEERPVIDLAETLDTPGVGENGDGMVVRIRDEVRPVALHCDEVEGQQEVVVKPFEGFMSGIPGLSGATVRGRGEVVNILDVNTL